MFFMSSGELWKLIWYLHSKPFFNLQNALYFLLDEWEIGLIKKPNRIDTTVWNKEWNIMNFLGSILMFVCNSTGDM